MKPLQRLELLKDMVQEAVDRGASSVEAIHQHIAALPFEVLEKTGLLDDERLQLRAKQQRTIGAVYDAIRRINRQVGELISDQFEVLEDGERAATTLRAATKKPAAKPRSAAARKAVKKAMRKKAVTRTE